MCAIFGSPYRDEFVELYNKNKCRGSAALGIALIHKHIFNEKGYKFQGEVDLNAFLDYEMCKDIEYFVGHTQAPTSAAQTYNPETTHPFECKNWLVAHNGVLTNFEQLKPLVKNKHTYNIVDSSIIPALLAESGKSATQAVFWVAEQLEGTHATWIYQRGISQLYITRCGSTLFFDDSRGSFSSVKMPGMTEVEDGTINILCNKMFKPLGKFNKKSPFFIL